MDLIGWGGVDFFVLLVLVLVALALMSSSTPNFISSLLAGLPSEDLSGLGLVGC